jgi:pyruvate formate lyase activating enzyme
MEGVIFDIKRFAIHDGPGIRTTVFMKGCPLNCFWCHNPESRKMGVEQLPVKGKMQQESIGKRIRAEELMHEILKDKVFYDHSGGGVTFSGGEPTMQPDFLSFMLTLCKENGLHTALDTSGYVPVDKLKGFLPFTDLFLFDLKFIDPVKHKRYTGVDNSLILHNLKYLDQAGAKIDMRIPLLPGYNDTDDELNHFLQIILSLENELSIHLLPYHETGKNKYRRFCLKEPEFKINPPDQGQIDRVKDFFQQADLPVQIGG